MNDELINFGKQLKSLTDKKKELKAEQTVVTEKIGTLQEKFVEAMELYKLQNFKVAGLGLFFIHASIFPKVIDQEKLFKNLKEKGAEDLIKETVFASTLRAYVNECIENSNEIPEGLDISTKTEVRIRKTK